jgi:nucleoside-diphosphate-sugar epimerase
VESFSQQLSRKILITGAGGFIGSHLCHRLSQDGHEVHAVSRTATPTDTDIGRWWQGDCSDFATVHSILRAVKPDVVFHLASHVAGARELEVVLPTFRNNLMSTVNLLTAATEIGCQRIVLVGSVEEPNGKDAEVTHISPYAVAKWASSTYGQMFYALYRTPVVIARIAMAYGPGQKDVRKLIPYVTLALLRGETPKLTSGHRLIDWIYIDDVVTGLLAAASVRDIEGCTVDLGSGVLLPIRTVIMHLVDLIGASVVPDFGALSDRLLEQARKADASHTYEKIGWKTVVPLEEGLARTVEWYRTHLHNVQYSTALSLEGNESIASSKGLMQRKVSL